MPLRFLIGLLVLPLLTPLCFAHRREKLRNDKVTVFECTLQLGEMDLISSAKPMIILSLGKGRLELTPHGGQPTTVRTEAGEVAFERAGLEALRNAGSSPLRLVEVEFSGNGSGEQWGRVGLSSHYKVLLENQFVRVYDIFIPASSSEPQHTHKNRIVVCLAGAELTHHFPDGKTEVSTLKTGEIAWRKGSTHVGENHSANDFHAIAIEPK